MSIHPWVTVEPPDSRGLRNISIGGKTVGSAWSFRELRKILDRLGYPEDMDMEDPASVHWRGGDSETWPDRPWRRRAIIALMVAGLLVSAVLHLLIGWPDVLGALTFAQRIVGALFILLGALQGVAAVAALDYWGRRQFSLSGSIILIGALIALATDSLLVFLWLQEKEYTHYLLAFVPLWFWSVWALYLIVREKPWNEIPHPSRFAAGAAAPALLTAVGLVYSTMYQPTSAPIHFALRAEFGEPQKDSGLPFVYIPLKLYAKNDGGIPVYIINDNYTVHGTTVKYSEKGDWLEQWKTDTEEAEVYAREDRKDVISSGHFYGPGSWLESGEEYSKETVVRLPKNSEYDSIDVELQFDFMRKDRGKIDTSKFAVPRRSWSKNEEGYYCPPEACGAYLVYSGRVRHNNNLVNVTRGRRYVTAFWAPDVAPTVFISSFDFKRKEEGERIDEAEMEREKVRYGHQLAFFKTEIPLAGLLSRSSGS
ncbi:DUF308 domain-containing protein [Streptomyces viridiviolaceus]|uniref:DUF308 domain-containing protein n=1 Tax=Streptomyces viridiviolaceus TaxID=68282 RepID=A0ABW2E9I3_9ACTN|nr:DUF308 domain-containing protein [Streptomyces viridiviolaceus]